MPPMLPAPPLTPPPLSPDDCRAARAMLGNASAAQAARLLGLADGRVIRRFEADRGRVAGARPPQGPLDVLYRLVLAGLVDRPLLERIAAEREGAAMTEGRGAGAPAV